MREFFTAERSLTRPDGGTDTVSYFVVVEDIVADDCFICESYGAHIVRRGSGKSEAEVHHITTNVHVIDKLMDRLVRNVVIPEDLKTVVEDLAAAS